MTWTPETNRIQTDLLTKEELAALQAAKHGWERWWTCFRNWGDAQELEWSSTNIYRAKPAPKRIVAWLHVNADGTCPSSTAKLELALSWLKKWGGWIKRIECDEDGSNMTVTDEVVE